MGLLDWGKKLIEGAKWLWGQIHNWGQNKVHGVQDNVVHGIERKLIEQLGSGAGAAGRAVLDTHKRDVKKWFDDANEKYKNTNPDDGEDVFYDAETGEGIPGAWRFG